MYNTDKDFFQDKFSNLKAELECVRHCALNDLIAGDSFSDCEHCIFKDGLEFNADCTICNRCEDLCVK